MNKNDLNMLRWSDIIHGNAFFLSSVFGILFQSGLFSIFLLWKPSPDDPAMFLATAFIWGCTAAVWDFIILSENYNFLLIIKNNWFLAFIASINCNRALIAIHLVSGAKIRNHNPSFASQFYILRGSKTISWT